MTSTFSCIQTNFSNERRLLKDILSIVQMAIIKMLVDLDQGGDLENKVLDFFNEMQNTNQPQ